MKNFLKWLLILAACRQPIRNHVWKSFLKSTEAEWRLYASINNGIIGSNNVLSPVRRQAIIWTNAGLLLTAPLGTNFNEISIRFQQFHSRKCIWICRLRNVGHLFSASMCWLTWILTWKSLVKPGPGIDISFSEFLAATKQLYEWYFPSVRLSVTPFWLCSHHRIIMKFSGVITNDKSDVHAKGQGQRSKVKVTPNLAVSGP